VQSERADPWSAPPVFIDRPYRGPTIEGPTVLPPSVVEVFWGKILTETGSGVYTFEEDVLTDGTTWTTLTGGRTGTCYEANDVAGIAVGEIIKIRVEYDTGGTLRYVFNSGGGTLPLADARYNALVANDEDLVFKPGWVRAH
jgi:hypothetical protein